MRLLGDLDLAEESMHEAFAAALETWAKSGIPEKPRPWLIPTARFKAIDAMRRRARLDGVERELVAHIESRVNAAPLDDEEIADDRLRLIFTCCHPALPREGQVGLTLREICGLTTEEIARAFLVPAATLAQRIVRATSKIRDASIPYEVPSPQQLPERLDWKNGKIAVTDGPYAETKEQLGGIQVLEARDLNHAIQIISQSPGLRLGCGTIETRPAADISEL